MLLLREPELGLFILLMLCAVCCLALARWRKELWERDRRLNSSLRLAMKIIEQSENRTE